ncbi:hypothetical protein ACFONG_16690 [Uliginosibacterium paludis]|uniref:Uncharacterized protein n=1 Tax=Uliginosibacterium paludis TaxID=1615952 RepID=A0ABV2CU07_9RHOO
MPETGTDALTRRLAGREFLLVPRSRSGLWLALCVTLLAVAGYAAAYATGHAPGRQPDGTQDQSKQEVVRLTGLNQQLSRELEELKMLQAHDKAALAALQKDYAEQVEALRQANRNLAFYRKNAPGSPSGGQ